MGTPYPSSFQGALLMARTKYTPGKFVVGQFVGTTEIDRSVLVECEIISIDPARKGPQGEDWSNFPYEIRYRTLYKGKPSFDCVDYASENCLYAL
jgi:hypothetical protein